jgi:Trk K+ transport system NAD-binding subunit
MQSLRRCGMTLEFSLNHLVKKLWISHIVVRMRDRKFLEAYRLAQASHIISTIDLAVALSANLSKNEAHSEPKF